ncbi:MAG TPA: UPF0280 family protein, partial [Alphaproteobacteria bacterium]|nr:UPF0280 family protein [Alphaproteobacteria bacterium]
RLHLQHGPIDLIIEAFGARDDVERAYAQAADAFGDVLPQLVKELSVLRTPLGAMPPVVDGPVARRMVTACWPHREGFITPMAAVAGSVADHVLQRMVRDVVVRRAYVNDGGDIAICLAPGETLTCGVAHDLTVPAIGGTIALTADMPVRGIATSGRACKGRGGRSFSFGIADAVTVLAADAAAADAAATVIANAVDLPGHAAVRRIPARDIDPDTDLGNRLVTWDVAPLSRADIEHALSAGAVKAESLRQAGHIYGAVLVLQRRFATVGPSLARLAA